ncbi:MAG: zinc-ribbon domain-containing protein [Methanobrevibacter sp.]|nr:zinc-ribbon domain-containing protein [Methanobrevibacter sp.]
MKCAECGAENRDHAKFCSKCGAKLSQTNIINNNTKNDGFDNKSVLIIVGTIIVVVAIILVTCYSLGMFGGNTVGNLQSDTTKDTGVSQVSLSAFPVSEAPNLAQQVAQSGSASSVSFKGVTLNKAQVAYILSKSISMIAKGDSKGTINVGGYSYATNPHGADVSQSISNAQYVDMCNRFSSWIERNNQVPNYIGINTGGVPDMSPTKMMNMCINILIQYKNTGSLPASVAV